MTDHPTACEEMHLLIQADLDGELDAAATAALAGHLRDCPGCTALQQELMGVSARMRTLPPMAAPAALRAALEARLRPVLARRVEARRRWLPDWGFGLGGFGLGAAMAAVALALLPGAAPDLDGELMAGHVRALQPGHLTDIASTDQHNVKPWFDGRLDYAPPVQDFAAAGFPLVGGRMDYIGGRAVAALVYRRDKHPIDLFVWPAADGERGGTGERRGFTIVRWTQGGMRFRAVSDLNAVELEGFARLWRGG